MRFQAKVLMFGITGVGKTSLLAAMYNALLTNPAFEGLAVTSDNVYDLDEALTFLKRYVRTLAAGHPEALASTPGRKDFTVKLDLPALLHGLDISFCDMPGEWLVYPQKRGDWISLIRESDVIINVISAPAMMESRREYNEDINKPSRFNEYLAEAFNEHSTTKAFFLVPVKCEKYIDEPASLEAAVKEVYNNPRALMRQGQHLCYALPVNTLGTVVFDCFSLDSRGVPKDHYKCKTNCQLGWEPHNHDVLVAQILDYYLAALSASFPWVSSEISTLRDALSGLLRGTLLDSPERIRYPKFEPESERGCFSSDTSVLLAGGKALPISLVEQGMEVLTLGEDGLVQSGVVEKVFRHANQPLVTLELEGTVLRVTPRHPLLTPQGWRQAADLRSGDFVVAYGEGATSLGLKVIHRVSQECVVDRAYHVWVRQTGCFFANGVVASSYVTLNGLRHARDRVLGWLSGSLTPEVTHGTSAALSSGTRP